MTYTENFDNAKDFLVYYNRLRLDNKHKWVFYTGKVCGKDVKAKSFNNWLQIYTINGIRWGGVMTDKVSEFKKVLHAPWE